MKFFSNAAAGFCGFSLVSLMLHIGFAYGIHIPGLTAGMWIAWSIAVVLVGVACALSALAIAAASKPDGGFAPNAKGMSAIVVPWVVLTILCLGGLASVWIR